MPTDGPARPWSKEQALARPARRYRRKVASAKQWAALQADLQGPCQVCGAPPPNQLHHLIARSQGGADVIPNLAVLCLVCHERVERRDAAFGHALAVSLSDASYAYVVDTFGETFFERRLGVVYSR